MKCKIPEISWHNKDPVLSVDIQPKSGLKDGSYRLASGGTDSHVLIWYINLASDGSDIQLDLAADLTRHQRAVNVVKWSPSGELLASGDDESVIFIWKQKAENEPLNILDNTNEQDKEVWITLKILRGHMEDVYDVSWAPNSQFLVSGSVDNTAMIWDVYKGKSQAILSDHKGFVQGVAWDPKNQYIATLSTDRYLRIFDIQSKRVLNRINKGTLPVAEDHELHGHTIRYFHDDTLQTFFRRLSFTPDGKLLITPAGVADYEGASRPLHTTYAFSRFALRQPAIVLPCTSDQYTVAVRCCPLLFRLRPHNTASNPPVIPLPYRMIFAVATRSSVYFYDTQQRQPFAVISNIHYTRLTDITWSSDGRVVVVSSTDGFCSLITFELGELGEEYENSAAVLDAALVQEMPTIAKKSKKQKEKENDMHSKKARKSSVDEISSKSVNSVGSLPSVTEEKGNNVEQKTATPIAIKRKEVEPLTEICVVTDKCADNVANPSGNKMDCKILSDATTQAGADNPVKLPVDIIIDKEILSSDEKFESPEKKSRPATPISVRRQPRTPSNTAVTLSNETSSAINIFKSISNSVGNSPLSSLKDHKSPHQQKRATPIAVRRTPRALIPATKTVETANVVVEEAMDAWPLEHEKNTNDVMLPPELTSEAKSSALVVNEATSACTEDIRLVYEDSTHDTVPEKEITEIKDKDKEDYIVETPSVASVVATQEIIKQKLQTPDKTPRRVALKTISTPKSKKKLIVDGN